MDNVTLARQNHRVGVHNMKKQAFAARSSLAALILSVSLAQAVTLTGACADTTSSPGRLLLQEDTDGGTSSVSLRIAPK